MFERRPCHALGVLLSLALLPAGCRSGGSGQCDAPASWFNGSTPAPNNFVANNNCDFHQWAWQAFLWLTQPSGAAASRRNFETFAYPGDLFVGSGEPPPYPGRTGQMLRLAVRRVKQDESVALSEISQAGKDDVLVDQQSQVVYYAVQINDVYYNFIRGNQYYIPDVLKGAPREQDFPTDGAGTIEIKTAWRLARVGERVYIDNPAGRFITTDALIAPVSIQDGQLVENTANPVQATVALVGVHVAGTVPNHAEFIWATFEHVDNAPDCASTPVGGGGPTGQPWSFYRPGTACGSGGGTCNAGFSPSKTSSLAPTEACRVVPQGGGSTDNVDHIKEINASVHGQLPATAIQRNYQLVGSLWTSGGLPARSLFHPLGKEQRGSLKLANVTMETFEQNHECFTCHNPSDRLTGLSRLNLGVSHVITTYGDRPYTR
jgi:hypothetical protein